MGRRLPANERRDQILYVARACFTKHGYEGTTTAMIARDAQVTEPIIYRHFCSKLGLFNAILEHILDEVRARFAALKHSDLSGAEKIVAIAKAFPAFSHDQHDFFRIADCALASSSEDSTRKLLREYYRYYERKLTELVVAGKDDGSIDPAVEPISFSWMLIMTGIGLSLVSDLDVPILTDEHFPVDIAHLVRSMLQPRG